MRGTQLALVTTAINTDTYIVLITTSLMVSKPLLLCNSSNPQNHLSGGCSPKPHYTDKESETHTGPRPRSPMTKCNWDSSHVVCWCPSSPRKTWYKWWVNAGRGRPKCELKTSIVHIKIKTNGVGSGTIQGFSSLSPNWQRDGHRAKARETAGMWRWTWTTKTTQGQGSPTCIDSFLIPKTKICDLGYKLFCQSKLFWL